MESLTGALGIANLAPTGEAGRFVRRAGSELKGYALLNGEDGRVLLSLWLENGRPLSDRTGRDGFYYEAWLGDLSLGPFNADSTGHGYLTTALDLRLDYAPWPTGAPPALTALSAAFGEGLPTDLAIRVTVEPFGGTPMGGLPVLSGEVTWLGGRPAREAGSQVEEALSLAGAPALGHVEAEPEPEVRTAPLVAAHEAGSGRPAVAVEEPAHAVAPVEIPAEAAQADTPVEVPGEAATTVAAIETLAEGARAESRVEAAVVAPEEISAEAVHLEATVEILAEAAQAESPVEIPAEAAEAGAPIEIQAEAAQASAPVENPKAEAGVEIPEKAARAAALDLGPAMFAPPKAEEAFVESPLSPAPHDLIAPEPEPDQPPQPKPSDVMAAWPSPMRAAERAADPFAEVTPPPKPEPTPVPDREEQIAALLDQSLSITRRHLIRPTPPERPALSPNFRVKSVHPFAPRVYAHGTLDPERGALLLQVRSLPSPSALGRQEESGRPWSAYRVWLANARTGAAEPIGLLGRGLVDQWRFEVAEGLELARFDTLLVCLDDRSDPQPRPEPIVLQGSLLA